MSLQMRWIGPPLEEGPKPLMFYFCLSAEETLYTLPYSAPVDYLKKKDMRIFSFDLPFHLPPFSNESALSFWAENPLAIEQFLSEAQETISELIKTHGVEGKACVAGLSRGAFIAFHLAARIEEISHILAFAPLTTALILEEFSKDAHSLTPHVERLAFKKIQAFCGNRDHKVGTVNCFGFLKRIVDAAYEKSVRSPPISLTIYPSIGKDGHGTPPSIFEQGAKWVEEEFAL